MPGLLDRISRDTPALTQAMEISQAAVDAGFEWESVDDVWTKVHEEIREFREAAPGSAHATEEFGDVLFTLVNVARKEGIDPQAALELTCEKFRERWQVMERNAPERYGSPVEGLATGQLVELWNDAKKELRMQAGDY